MNELPANDELVQKLHRETAKIRWRELQRFFAAGKVVVVQSSADLVQIAAAFANDDARYVAELLAGDQVSKVNDGQAARWYDENALLWAVVVSPWVLVQTLPPTAERPQ